MFFVKPEKQRGRRPRPKAAGVIYWGDSCFSPPIPLESPPPTPPHPPIRMAFPDGPAGAAHHFLGETVSPSFVWAPSWRCWGRVVKGGAALPDSHLLFSGVLWGGITQTRCLCARMLGADVSYQLVLNKLGWPPIAVNLFPNNRSFTHCTF